MTMAIDAKLSVPVGEKDHILGSADAPVTLVEYGDLECPYCRQVNPVIKELRRRLGNRVRYVFRHFPIRTSHVHAQLAAEAAEAASAQGKFWEMQEYIFQHQGQLDENHLVTYAGELELDVEQFKRDLDEHTYAELVREDFNSGVRSGVNGTPTFFINGARYDGPWDLESLIEAVEKPLGAQVRMLAQEFARLEASGGLVLVACAILALFWANSSWAESYFHLWETKLAFSLGNLSLSLPMIEWVNDGLMVLFFFVVGLEIKRQLTTGDLASLRRAALPLAGAAGGMLLPAGLYLALNAGGTGQLGWGIPMATDIAFTLGILALLGSRAPLSLKVFVTALAIADDLGAVLVIALFYTSEISWIWLIIAAVIFIALIGFNRARVYEPWPYALLGLGLWFAFLESGIHPTIAGVLLATTIPSRNPPKTGALLAQCISVLNEFEDPAARQARADDSYQSAAQTLEVVADRMQSPAQRLEHTLHPWTTYLILPIFALANAGVHLKFDLSLFGPISVGVLLGLVIGKPLGITILSWLTIKLGWAELPPNVSWRQLFSVSWLAGIGFTMSLFITNAAFIDPELLDQAKIGVIFASVVAGIIGSVLMVTSSPTHAETTHLEIAPATD